MKLRVFIYTAAIVSFILSFSSCEKLSDLLKAEVPVSIPFEVTIPVTAEGETIYFDQILRTIDIDEAIQNVNNQLGREHLKSVTLYNAFIEIPATERDNDINLILISDPVIRFLSDARREWADIASFNGPCDAKFLQIMNFNTSSDWVDYFKTTDRYAIQFECKAYRNIPREIKVRGQVHFVLKVST